MTPTQMAIGFGGVDRLKEKTKICTTLYHGMRHKYSFFKLKICNRKVTLLQKKGHGVTYIVRKGGKLCRKRKTETQRPFPLIKEKTQTLLC